MPFSCPSLVYLTDMHGIYESYVPLLIKKTSFEVKKNTVKLKLCLYRGQLK